MGFDPEIFKNYKSLTVSGHFYADADSIISTWLMGKVLKSVGVKPLLQYPLAGDESSTDRKFIEDVCEYLSIPLYEFDSNRNGPFIYVDYSGIPSEKNLVAAFDHHMSEESYYVFEQVYRRKSSATAYIIFDLFKGYVNWTKEDIKAVAAAVILDTQYLTNERKLVPDEVEKLELLGIDMKTLCQELMETLIPFPDLFEINQHVKYESFRSAYVGPRSSSIMYKSMYVEMYCPGYSIDDAPVNQLMDMVEKNRADDESIAFFFYDYDKKRTLLLAKICVSELEPFTLVKKFDFILSRGDGFKEYLEDRLKGISLEKIQEGMEETITQMLAIKAMNATFPIIYLSAVLRDKGIQSRFFAGNEDKPTRLEFPWGTISFSVEEENFVIKRKKVENV